MLKHFTPFALSGLFAGIFSVAFGVFVLIKSRDRKLGRIWFLFTMAAAGWGFGGVWIGMTPPDSSPRTAFVVAYSLGVVWIAPLFYHFTCLFLKNVSHAIKVQYLTALLFCATVPSRWFFQHSTLVVGDFQAQLGGPLYPLFFIWWMGCIVYSHWLLIRAYRRENQNKRNQIMYFFLATAIGFTGGSLCYLPSFNISVYPWGNFAVFVYPIIMSYAMLKFQLLDVRIFLRRAALLIGVYFGLLLVGLLAVSTIHSIAITPAGISKPLILTEVALVSVLLSFGPFFYAHTVRNRSYFKEHTMAGLTHELKSPLAAMESALEIFAARIAEKMDAKDLEYLAMLKNNQERLRTSVNALLGVYKIEGESSLRYSDVQPQELIEIIEQTFYSLLTLKKIRLVSDIPPRQAVQADKEKILQVLGNVVSNAIKFSDGGTITVSVRSQPHRLEFSVRDQGTGIAQDELPYVFDRFFQSKNNHTQRGTGIGLTIAKAWVEAHGGKIWAESDGVGKGATVTFTLPV